MTFDTRQFDRDQSRYESQASKDRKEARAYLFGALFCFAWVVFMLY